MDITIIQENWQWVFALSCLGFYLWDKNKSSSPSKEPSNKIEEIGQKAEEILRDAADDFVEEVEEEVLEALENKVEEVAEKAVEEIKSAVLPPESKKEPSTYSPSNGYPDPSRVSKARLCPCGSGKKYRGCHSQFWKSE